MTLPKIQRKEGGGGGVMEKLLGSGDPKKGEIL